MVLFSTFSLIPPLGNLNMVLGKLIPPALVFYPGHAWKGSLNLGLEATAGMHLNSSSL